MTSEKDLANHLSENSSHSYIQPLDGDKDSEARKTFVNRAGSWTKRQLTSGLLEAPPSLAKGASRRNMDLEMEHHNGLLQIENDIMSMQGEIQSAKSIDDCDKVDRLVKNDTGLIKKWYEAPQHVKDWYISDYDIHSWRKQIFSLRGRVFPKTPLFCFLIWITLLAFLFSEGYVTFISLKYSVLAPVSFVLGFLLVYRSNQAISKWWQGRSAWEDIESSTGSMYAIVLAHLPDTIEAYGLSKVFGQHLIAFAVCIKTLLYRDQDWATNLKAELKFMDDEYVNRILKAKTIQGCCISALLFCHCCVACWVRNDMLRPPFGKDIIKELNMLNKLVGRMEMISTTPIPYNFVLHARFILICWLILLPLSLFDLEPFDIEADGNPYWLIPYYMLIAYAFLGLDKLAVELEHPFGDGKSDLPIPLFCENISSQIVEMSYIRYLARANIQRNLDGFAEGKAWGEGSEIDFQQSATNLSFAGTPTSNEESMKKLRQGNKRRDDDDDDDE